MPIFTYKLIVFAYFLLLRDFYNFGIIKIGGKIVELRKKKKLTPETLGKLIGTSGAVIGRFERQEITPSVEIANKMASSLGVSLDYLVGNLELELTDTLVERVKEVSKMSEKLRLLDELEDIEKIIFLILLILQ